MIEKLEEVQGGRYIKFRCSCGIHFNVLRSKIRRIKSPLRCKKCQALNDKITKSKHRDIVDSKLDIIEYTKVLTNYCNSDTVYGH